MRIVELLLGCVLLVCCLITASEAVACTAPDVPTDCTDCSDGLNVDEPDCTTTTTTTTAATVTVVRTQPKRKVVRITNLRYTNVRRVRVNGNRSPAAATNNVRNTNARVVGVIVG